MNKDECEQAGGTWDEGTMMCTHPENTTETSTEAETTENEPESM